ncbi:MAG: hypothetical protein GTO30_06815, partial [Acidobacteria bacterium]|nr:hypothetical protein [Acidobacteriota bacterium]NIQ86865.1 hypothetical protein [Acidobacteriota bacterium]
HPTLLDAVFQLPTALAAREEDDAHDPLTATEVKNTVLSAASGTMTWLHARIANASEDAIETDITCYDGEGAVVATLTGVVHRRL